MSLLIMKAYCVLALFLLLLVPAQAGAQQSGPASLSLGIRQTMSDLDLAVKQSEALDAPMSAVDQLEKWQALVEQTTKIKTAIHAASVNTDAVIANLKAKAENYEPDKAAVLSNRIEKLQAQSDSLFLLGGEMDKAAALLQKSIDRIKSDPEVKSYLESKKLIEDTDAVVSNAVNAVPGFMK